MESLAGFTLVGGTALALQIGHRRSLDLDFAQFADHLDRQAIHSAIQALKVMGSQVRLVTDPGLISAHRINTGTDLLNYAQDYVVDGVKLTFFAHGKNEAQKAFYRDAEKVGVHQGGFTLLGLDGLKAAKTLVLDDRVRSRDLFDLYFLVRDHGWSLEEMTACIRGLGVTDDPEVYFEKLSGNYPVDATDEGLDAVGVSIGTAEIYQFFCEQIDDYQIRQSRLAWQP